MPGISRMHPAHVLPWGSSRHDWTTRPGARTLNIHYIVRPAFCLANIFSPLGLSAAGGVRRVGRSIRRCGSLGARQWGNLPPAAGLRRARQHLGETIRCRVGTRKGDDGRKNFAYRYLGAIFSAGTAGGVLRMVALVLPPDLAFLTVFRLRPSDFRLRPSDFRLRPSDFRLRPSDFRLRPSDYAVTSRRDKSP